VGKWVKYDALLFKKLDRELDREWSLSDFRPFPDKGALDTPRGLGATSEGRHLVPAKSLRRSNTRAQEYRRHLDGRSPDPVELRIATGLLGCHYGIADLVSGKNSNGNIVHAFRSRRWPLSMRMAFASQIRGAFELRWPWVT
jgi:hypothetical protein